MLRFILPALGLLGVLLLAQSATASSWGFDLEGGTSATWWFTSDDDDSEEGVGHAIDYEAEPASSWTAAGALRYGNHRVVGLSVTQPFGDAPEQTEAVAKTTSATTALQDYIAFLQLVGLVNPESDGFVTFLAGLRLDYRRLSGLVPLAVGDEIQLRANFEDWYLTVLRFQSRGRDLRIGLYKSVLEKPHETLEGAIGTDVNLVIETRLSGGGVFVQGVSSSWDFLLRAGTVDFEPQGDLEGQRVFGGSGSFSMLMEFGWNPNIVLAGPPTDGSHSLPRLVVQPAVGFLFRADYLNPENEAAGSAYGELSMDILVDAGARVVWRF